MQIIKARGKESKAVLKLPELYQGVEKMCGGAGVLCLHGLLARWREAEEGDWADWRRVVLCSLRLALELVLASRCYVSLNGSFLPAVDNMLYQQFC
jgi:hypothetical protein